MHNRNSLNITRIKKVLPFVVGVFAIIFLFLGKQRPCLAVTVCSSQQHAGSIAARYVWYSPQTLSDARAHGRVVLYFWAPWCGHCKIIDDELKGAQSELPTDATVVKVDYDAQKDIVGKYGITAPQAFLQIDPQDHILSQWVGGDITTLKTNLK